MNVKLIDTMRSTKSDIGTLWGKSIDARIRRMKLVKKTKEQHKSHFNRDARESK